jgi:putative Holliday junction resolvase
MRYLGLDVGDKRIGVAVSDPCQILASPFDTVIRENDKTAIELISRIVQTNNIPLIIIGLPYSLNGTIGEQAKKVMDFADLISQSIGVEIKFQDERLSTISANKRLIESGMKTGKRKERKDSAAAAIILQSYLDSQVISSE